MNIVLNQNARQCAVEQLKTDDLETGLPAGTWILSPEIYEKIKEFLTQNVEKNAA